MEIAEIKSRLSILDVLSHYGLAPDRNSRLHCPFHDDKTPSMQIYAKTGTFCCFSSNCQAGTGDQIQFIELMEKRGKHEAIKKAASLLGEGQAAPPPERNEKQEPLPKEIAPAEQAAEGKGEGENHIPLSQILPRLSFAEVIKGYGLKADKHLRVPCPFHEDDGANLQLSWKANTASCLSPGCRTEGRTLDIVDFVSGMDKTHKREALEKCRKLMEGSLPPAPPQGAQLAKAAVLTKMFIYFRNAVHNSKPARDYIASRGLEFARLEIGYNTGQFHHGARKDEALIRSCQQVGLLTEHDHLSRTREISYRPFAKYCIVFALRNRSGQVTGLYFRSTLTDEQVRAKGDNPANRGTHFYLKDREGLYPAYPKADAERLILTESVIDAATLLQQPAIAQAFTVLACYGANGLTGEHLEAIGGLRALREIVFAFDNDEAGRQGAKKYGAQLRGLYPALALSTLHLPENEDINSVGIGHEGEVFIHLLAKRTALLEGEALPEGAGERSAPEKELLFSTEKPSTESPSPSGGIANAAEKDKSRHEQKPSVEKKKPASAAEKKSAAAAPAALPAREVAGAAAAAASPSGEGWGKLDSSNPWKLRYATPEAEYQVLGGLPKTLDSMKVTLLIAARDSPLKSRSKVDLYEDKSMEKCAREAAEKLGLAWGSLEGGLSRLADLLDEHRERELRESQPAASPEPGEAPYPLTALERKEAEGFLKQPGLIKRLGDLLGEAGIVGEEKNRLFLLLIATSCKMPDTLHALIQGSSGSGKTRLLKQISDCIPPEKVTRLTRLSDKVLYNYPEHFFVNRLLCLEDIDGLSEEAEFAFRELQSNGELNSATSVKLDNGQITSGQKTVRGPIASMACTTRGEIYEDNMSRVFLIAVDESHEQTKRIIDYQNRKAAGEIDSRKEQETKRRIQNMVRVLSPCEVVNPYAGRIRLPEEAHKIRRLNDLFQSFIKQITLLNQYRRKKDEKGRLIAEASDVQAAIAVMFESIVLKVDELDGSLRQFYERLKAYLKKQPGGEKAEFSLREVRQALNLSKTQLFRYTNDLMGLEYLRQSGGHINKGFRYRICYWDDYSALRGRIKAHLESQLESLKGTPAEHERNAQQAEKEPVTP